MTQLIQGAAQHRGLPTPVIRMHADPTLVMPWTAEQLRLLDQFAPAGDTLIARLLRWQDQIDRHDHSDDPNGACFECGDLVTQMGILMGPVLRRLADVEAGPR